MAEPKIKSCPFCGGEAEEKRTGHAPDWKYKVVCTRCGCRTGETVCSPSHIRTWNTRAERECKDVCADVAQFTCSACGFECDLTSWITHIEHKHHGTPNHCPKCGARVASGR